MTVIALKFNAEMYRNTLQFYGVALPFIILNVINLLKYFSSRVYGENFIFDVTTLLASIWLCTIVLRKNVLLKR